MIAKVMRDGDQFENHKKMLTLIGQEKTVCLSNPNT